VSKLVPEEMTPDCERELTKVQVKIEWLSHHGHFRENPRQCILSPGCLLRVATAQLNRGDIWSYPI